MKKIATLAAICCTLAVNAQSTCATALPVQAGPVYSFPMIDGTAPVIACPPGAYPGAHAIWYSFSPLQDTGLVITTDLAQNAGHDTRFFVYKGTCDMPICVGSDDDSGSGDLAVLSLNVTAGTMYLIAFDSYWSDAGSDFQLQETTPFPNYFEFTQVPLALSVGWPTCAVDMNGDHLDDVVGTSQTVIDVNYQQQGGGFQHVVIPTPWAQNDAGWSICAGDLDGNGFNDLMYGGGQGTTFMLANSDGTAYTPLTPPEYIFCQRTNMVDINNDGHLDAFSCHDVSANVYFLNDGNNNLLFQQGGLGNDCGNYGSIWTDIDGDGDLDLFVAKCGCDPIDILCRNNGDGTFAEIATALGFADYQQSWSSAWGDFDNDGDMDAMVGTSTGDYQKLMRNDGATFTNITAGSGFDTFHGSTIEWVTYDFDNDGYLDILGGGMLMRNNGDMTFSPVAVPPMNGPIGDLNNDGFLDIVNAGAIYMNSGNGNHHLTVRTIGTVSNRNGIGARIEVVSALGTQIREVRSGDGFGYMSSLNTYFGLGADQEIDHVTVHWPSGVVNTIDHPAVDGTLEVIEGVNTAVAGTTTAHTPLLFPNPTDGRMNIVLPAGVNVTAARVFDVSGEQVREVALHGGRIDVTDLKPGMYLLRMLVDGLPWQERFTKR